MPTHLATSAPPGLRPLAAAAMMFGGLALPVEAGNEQSLNGSMVRMEESDQQGAVAEVVFENRAVNSEYDNGAFPLDHAGLGISVTFRWNTNPQGDDEILIETDAAHVAVPRRLVVAEGSVGTAQIYPLERVGF